MTTAAPMPLPFPFAAIAGQPLLRQALLLAAVDPGLGGVLIEGPRGTAKTTAARALAELLPGAPFVTLPLGASLESLVGTLDLGQALAGHELRFAPGLLARAHGGVLYVDEINLLPDALIDSLLDAAASGVNVVERDGISHRHAARFVLVGTMNPEEGTLRPQLLDRFGLCVQLRNIEDAAERQAIVRARLAFDADPQGFRAKHAQEEAALAEALVRGRAVVADARALPYGDAVHEAVSALCIAAGADGLRADLVMLRSARALAAWEGRRPSPARMCSAWPRPCCCTGASRARRARRRLPPLHLPMLPSALPSALPPVHPPRTTPAHLRPPTAAATATTTAMTHTTGAPCRPSPSASSA
jgi:magnesium chelatase subunit I